MKSYVIVSSQELKARKGDLVLTPDNVQELLEYKDVFIKFLKKSAHKVRSQFYNLEFVGKEGQGYNAILTIEGLIKDLDSLEGAYKDLMEKRETEKK